MQNMTISKLETTKYQLTDDIYILEILFNEHSLYYYVGIEGYGMRFSFGVHPKMKKEFTADKLMSLYLDDYFEEELNTIIQEEG